MGGKLPAGIDGGKSAIGRQMQIEERTPWGVLSSGGGKSGRPLLLRFTFVVIDGVVGELSTVGEPAVLKHLAAGEMFRCGP